MQAFSQPKNQGMISPKETQKPQNSATYSWRVAYAWGLCSLTMMALTCASAFAVPACPKTALIRQPHGPPFLAKRIGDERRGLTETADGYTVIGDAATGTWFYAMERGKGLAKSPFAVGTISPDNLGLRKRLRPSSPELTSHSSGTDEGDNSSFSASSLNPYSLSAGDSTSPRSNSGTIKNLVILARFSDHVTFVSRDELDELFNQPGYTAGGAVGSVRDYYLDVSANQLTIDSTVSEWVPLPRDESFYGANNASGADSSPHQLVRDAVRSLELLGFDFRPFDADSDGSLDMVTVIHSGLGEEHAANPTDSVWSQVITLTPAESVNGVRIHRAAIAPERRYNTTSITRIGVICHELGHLLGLPDLYDTDGSSWGIGVWGLMGTGSWGGDSGSPERPVHPCCWSKVQVGWLTPTEIEGSDSPVSVPSIEKAGSWGAYKISCEMGSGEYLLVENRRQSGYNQNLPAPGLLMWHIDENQSSNWDESHYRVALLQADGHRDLEEKRNRGDAGDPFPGNADTRQLDDTTSPGTTSYINGPTHIRIYNISDSVATMSFDISTLADVYGESFSKGLASSWTVVDGSDDGYTWTDLNPGERSHPSWSGRFVIVDSDAAGWRSMDEQLISPQYDCSLSTHTHVKFDHFFRASSGQTGDVDVRIDGGKWQNVARYKFDDAYGKESLDISSLADGHFSVEVRWRLYNISFGWYWGIDSFAIRGELPDNTPPEIVITSVSQRPGDPERVDIRFIGTDLESDPATWLAEDCQYAPQPFTTWYPLAFDTAHPANTALEPMPFTSTGQIFVAVVDASDWNGLFKIRLRVTDGTLSRAPVVSDEFLVDKTPPVVTTPTCLDENPLSGATSVTALAEWSDANPDITWFQLRRNGGPWGDPVQGEPQGQATQAATLTSLPLDGDDTLTVKSYHIDVYGNQSEESISPDYYVTPLSPFFPSLRNPTRDSLRVIVRPNALEQGDVDYAVYCTTLETYVDWAQGSLVPSPIWGTYDQWGGPAGMIVTGLSSKTSYGFRVVASNPHDREERSEFSPPGYATTLNSPPNRPASISVTPEGPLTADNLVCRVTPAVPPDDDPGDIVRYRYVWSTSGALDIVHGPWPSMMDTLPALYTRKSQTWTCTVEPYDLTDYGPAIQRSVVVGNTLPKRVLSLRFTPTAPRTPQDIVCTVTPASPADDDAGDVVSYRYTWSCPEKSQVVHGPAEALSDTLSHARTTKGDTWTCTVEPYDGGGYGPAFTRQVTVVNSPPSIEVLGQKGGYPDQSIHLTIVSSDDDGDPVSLANPDAPPDATFIPDVDGTATFFWPHPLENTSQDVFFSASDGSDEAVESVLLTFSQTVFEISSVGGMVQQGGEQAFVITWYALPGVTYSVHRSSNLQSWHSVASAVSLPEGSRSPDWLTYQEGINDSHSSPRYYRVRM